MNKDATLTLPVNAWNVILHALSQRPYVEVVELLEEIKNQIEPQLKAQTESVKE